MQYIKLFDEMYQKLTPLGENIIGGKVNPDEFFVFKPTLENSNMPILKR